MAAAQLHRDGPFALAAVANARGAERVTSRPGKRGRRGCPPADVPRETPFDKGQRPALPAQEQGREPCLCRDAIGRSCFDLRIGPSVERLLGDLGQRRPGCLRGTRYAGSLRRPPSLGGVLGRWRRRLVRRDSADRRDCPKAHLRGAAQGCENACPHFESRDSIRALATGAFVDLVQGTTKPGFAHVCARPSRCVRSHTPGLPIYGPMRRASRPTARVRQPAPPGACRRAWRRAGRARRVPASTFRGRRASPGRSGPAESRSPSN